MCVLLSMIELKEQHLLLLKIRPSQYLLYIFGKEALSNVQVLLEERSELITRSVKQDTA